MRTIITGRVVAMAAAKDAGDRSMRKARRKVWNEQDFYAASREYNRINPATMEERALKTA